MKSLMIALLFTLGLQSAFAAAKDQVIEIQVTEKGFEPESVNVKAGEPVTLKVTRKTDSTCAKQIKVQPKNVKKDLPLNETITIALGKLEKGEIRFACGMDMATGQIIVK